VGQDTSTTGTKNGCTGNGTCTTYMFNLSNVTSWGTSVTPAATLPAQGGTSGIIVDNFSTTFGGASQIYYSTLGIGTSLTGAAIQASQAGLQ
jgi:hypothetical protein